MFCTSCGASVSDEHTFCSGCGRPVQKPLANARQDRVEIIEAHQVPPQRSYDAPPTTQYRPTPPPPQSQHPVASPVYVTQQVQVASPVTLRPLKSVGLAIFLGLLFGPFGLFYASAAGGLIMLIGGIVATAATYGVAAPFVWIACAVWGGIAASNYNAAALAGHVAATQINRY